jgi:glycerophosphoryl diester phosphodiesterase
MSDGVAITRNGHRTLFKWHRARKQLTDLPFTGERVLEGLRAGASVEVDLVKHADGGFAVLHDFALDRHTTGQGLVKDTSAKVLRTLSLRDGSGTPTTHKVMLLEDLCALLLTGVGFAPDGIVQLDLKEEDPTALGEREISTFAASVGPVAQHFILSGGNAETMMRLADRVPHLGVGYDPCHAGAIERLMENLDFTGFVADAVAAVPRATMIYLEYRLVLGAVDRGFDLIAAFHAAGRTIDAYTLNDATPRAVAIAERLLGLRVDQITTDDPIGLEIALGR